MNKKIKYPIFIVSGFFLFIFLSIIFMAIFRLCPPIKAGPQPPWCLNVERFERDFNMNSLGGLISNTLIKITPKRESSESIYSPISDDVDYIQKPIEKTDYSISFGVAPSDFFWPVCVSFNACINPKKQVTSTFSRINSIGGNFIVLIDYVRIKTNKEIYEDKTALSNKEINRKLNSASKYNLDTIVLINLFLDEVSVRHTKAEYNLEEDRVFEKGHQIIAMSNWAPNEQEINLLFDRWEEILIKKVNRWEKAGYIVINPDDLHFHFTTHPEVMNKRNKQLITKTREIYDGKICVHFKDLNYLRQFTELDYYRDADCIILGGHPSFEGYNMKNDVESFETFYIDYFSDPFFLDNSDKEVYQMISTMSYDKYLEDRWFEVVDYDVLGLNYKPDFRLQANSYEGFFRAIQKVQPPIEGIFHYGYWWEDTEFDKDKINVKFMNSIRNKDAEHIYYRWNAVLS
jgi:hypothetical protein